MIVEPADGRYGSMAEDGSWDGMIKELMDDVRSSFLLLFVRLRFQLPFNFEKLIAKAQMSLDLKFLLTST